MQIEALTMEKALEYEAPGFRFDVVYEAGYCRNRWRLIAPDDSVYTEGEFKVPTSAQLLNFMTARLKEAWRWIG